MVPWVLTHRHMICARRDLSRIWRTRVAPRRPGLGWLLNSNSFSPRSRMQLPSLVSLLPPPSPPNSRPPPLLPLLQPLNSRHSRTNPPPPPPRRFASPQVSPQVMAQFALPGPQNDMDDMDLSFDWTWHWDGAMTCSFSRALGSRERSRGCGRRSRSLKSRLSEVTCAWGTCLVVLCGKRLVILATPLASYPLPPITCDTGSIPGAARPQNLPKMVPSTAPKPRLPWQMDLGGGLAVVDTIVSANPATQAEKERSEKEQLRPVLERVSPTWRKTSESLDESQARQRDAATPLWPLAKSLAACSWAVLCMTD